MIPLADVPPLISAEALQERIAALGREITQAYAGKETPVVVGVLKGCFVFMSDLIRNIDLLIECDFLGLQSYGDRKETSGVVKITSDLNFPIVGRNVLVVEDIYD
ncbi:MAG: hypoxanthine phosphoribosyltransferase, partial [Deltaproteobacteria bacterium]